MSISEHIQSKQKEMLCGFIYRTSNGEYIVRRPDLSQTEENLVRAWCRKDSCFEEPDCGDHSLHDILFDIPPCTIYTEKNPAKSDNLEDRPLHIDKPRGFQLKGIEDTEPKVYERLSIDI